MYVLYRNMKKYHFSFLSENFHFFLLVKFSVNLNRNVYVMCYLCCCSSSCVCSFIASSFCFEQDAVFIWLFRVVQTISDAFGRTCSVLPMYLYI